MKRLTLVQPFLFAVFPILSLYASNVKLVHPDEVLVPTAIVFAVTALFFFLITRLLGDRDGAALILSVFWLLFFSYGRVLSLINNPNRGRESFLLVAWALVLVGSIVATIRWRRRLGTVASLMNIVGVALVLMPLITIAVELLPQKGTQATRLAERLPAATSAPLPTSTPIPRETDQGSLSEPPRATPPTASPRPPLPAKPDIYYIILDGYARADVLQDLFGWDNSEFLNWLAEKGFVIAEESQANYCQTYLSLASSLNMTYLDDVASHPGVEADDRRPLQEMVKDNAVAGYLHKQGYTYVAYATGYAEAELQSADMYITAPWSLTQFQSGLINTTPISPLISLQYDLHRERLLYALDHLADAAAIEGPVFVLAHIAAPHPPFVFDENGGAITPNREFMFSDGSHYLAEGSREEYVRGYVGQVRYITARVKETIAAILTQSAAPPIIIIQADHGPGSRLDWYDVQKTDLRERMAILNAYYLPGDVNSLLYDEITPVNSFRLVFSQYFGADYPLLEDRSYFSTWDRPYEFVEVSR